MAKASGYHLDKKLERAIPDPLPIHDFRSDVEHRWFTRYFRDRKLMVERPLDDTWSDPSTIPFFLTRLRAYPGWVAVLTARKRVNIDWVREACATLVPDPVIPRTLCSYVRGREITLSTASVSAALGLPPVPNHTYPSQLGETFPLLQCY